MDYIIKNNLLGIHNYAKNIKLKNYMFLVLYVLKNLMIKVILIS